MESLKILLLAVAAAVVYGILHDQVTARICVEYFTIGHAPIFGTDNPTLLGLGWGVLATWWVGVLLGMPLVVVARGGSLPKRDARSLVKPIGWLMLAAALGATIAGLIGWIAASVGWIRLAGRFATEVPAEMHIPFRIDGFAHTASYGVGFLGGLVVLAVVWYERLRDGQPAVDRQSADNPSGRGIQLVRPSVQFDDVRRTGPSRAVSCRTTTPRPG